MACETKEPVSRERLLSAMQNTYDDAEFLVAQTVNDADSFLTGRCCNRSSFWSKEQVLAAIHTSPLTEFSTVPGNDDEIVLNEHLAVWRDSINKAQILPETADVDGFIHVHEKMNRHYDIFFKIDHVEKKITFALGGHRKTLSVEEHTEWVWKPTRTSILCIDSEKLERDFLDDFWNPIAVRIGRKVLGIKNVV